MQKCIKLIKYISGLFSKSMGVYQSLYDQKIQAIVNENKLKQSK